MKSFRTILVIHQTPIIRKGIRLLLERQNAWTAIIYESDSFADAAGLLGHATYDVLIMDDHAAEEYYATGKLSVPHLLVYAGNSAALCAQVTATGKNGFLPVSAASRDLYEAMEAVLGGKSFYMETRESSLKASVRYPGTKTVDMEGVLTRREQEIFEMILQELTNEEIAEKLHVSRRTVEGHKQNITRKLNVKSLVGLTRLGIQAGML